ncbi:MAG: DUF294 nucleotidyltransferase-like domain-containing protein [Candidatus Competibacterales bacterium]
MDNPIDFALALRSAIAATGDQFPKAMKALLGEASQRVLVSQEPLVTPGMPYGEEVYHLRQGTLELRHGHTQLTLEPGDFIGLENHFGSGDYSGAVTAVTEAVVDVIAEPVLQRFEQSHPELFTAVNRLLADHFQGQRQRRAPVTGLWVLPARSIMKSPLVTVQATEPLPSAYQLMRQRGIGSLGVVDSGGHLQGVVTLHALTEALIVEGVSRNAPIIEAVEPPRRVAADTPLWKIHSALEPQAKYFVVCEGQAPVGVVSQTDILRILAAYQRSLIVQINAAPDYVTLAGFHRELAAVADELRQHNHSASRAVRALSEVHLAIQRRCVELAEEEVVTQLGFETQIPYAFIVMGSGGRREMMINTDQDNGIIIDDAIPLDDAHKEWFQTFCDRANRRLDEVGYEWCTGDIMARNPDYHQTLGQWCQRISRIAEFPNEGAARWSTIVFDFDTLYGDDRLTRALRHHLLAALKAKPRLLRLMVEDDASGGPALGFLNRLVTATDKPRRGKIDLKRNGTRLLADAARIYALAEGVQATHSGDRLEAVVRQGRLDGPFVEAALAAYEELLDLTLAHQLRQIQQGERPDKLVSRQELTPLEEESLRMAMKVIKRLQSRMQTDFNAVIQ